MCVYPGNTDVRKSTHSAIYFLIKLELKGLNFEKFCLIECVRLPFSGDILCSVLGCN